MKTFEIRFNVDGKSGGSIIIEAADSIQARRLALGQIQGQAGYYDKKITITAIKEIR